jgi:DNA-binding NarL/FixJ family response regulator
MKTLLVDDHGLFRDGMALLVARSFPQLELLEASSLAEALRQLDSHRDLRLAFLDLGLPDSEALDTLAAFRRRAPHVCVIVVSADASPATVLKAIDAGAAGFIPKTARSHVMQTALQVVLDGGVYLPQPLVSVPDRPWKTGLTPRELGVLSLLVQGQSNKLMCRQLDIAESTVKTHLEAIFRKLGVASRTQAVVAVAGLGLRLPVPPRRAG